MFQLFLYLIYINYGLLFYKIIVSYKGFYNEKNIITHSFFPYFAYAQEQLQPIPENIIDAAVKKFAITFCKDNTDKKIQAVYDCYRDAGVEKKERVALCFLADTDLMVLITKIQNKARHLGRSIPYENTSFLTKDRYTSDVSRFIRSYYLNDNYTQKQFDEASSIFPKDYIRYLNKMVHKCKEINPSLSNYFE